MTLILATALEENGAGKKIVLVELREEMITVLEEGHRPKELIISVSIGFLLVGISLLLSLLILSFCRESTRHPVLSFLFLTLFSLTLSLGAARLAIEIPHQCGIIAILLMAIITITLIFFYAACCCLYCRKVKDNGQIDILPGIIISACISFTAMLLTFE